MDGLSDGDDTTMQYEPVLSRIFTFIILLIIGRKDIIRFMYIVQHVYLILFS